MADDGMLLNFELPSDAFAPKKSFKGGSWKDRLTAKKSAAYGRQKAQERATGRALQPFGDVQSEDEELVLPGSQPAKRVKTGEHGEFKPRPERGPTGPHRGDNLPKSTTGEVISSLFTYNPSSAAKVPPGERIAEDETPIEPSNAPLNHELASFTTLGLSSSLASHLLRKLEIKAPTAIQRKAVSQLCGKDTDAFIQAQTGSGKTLAYLLPIVQRITDISRKMKDEGMDFNRESGLFALVLAPTRELSKQISTVLEGLLSCCHWIVGGIVIGGEKKKSEKARLRKGLNILVATPGRLADHFNNTEVLDVSKVRWLVLDEGDRLMELGFENDIQKIVSVLNLRSRKAQEHPTPGLPERRTTVLCSATIKANVEQLRTIALKDPVSIAVDAAEAAEAGVGTKEQAFTAPAQLKQSYAVVPAKQRLVTLVAVLKQAFKRKGSVLKCIVFMSCADSVDFHFEVLSRPETSKTTADKETPGDSSGRRRQVAPKLSKSDKIPQGHTISQARTEGAATAISSKDSNVQIFRLHGSLQQATRTSTLKAYTKCTDPAILVCTDVASRGLDLPNVDLVVEYDAPFSKDDHLHRVGRTARAGKAGRAMIFLLPGCEEGYVDVLKEGKPRNLTRHDADELLQKAFSPSSGVVNEQSWVQEATEWQIDVERKVVEDPKHLEQARRAFQSHVRAYATHVAAERSIFNMQQLHLGHLAKAFGLRDKPGSIRVPGQRPGAAAGAKNNQSRKVQAGKAAAAGSKRQRGDEDDFETAAADAHDARRKMMSKMKAMSGVSEFNLG
ncbi:hypothetical protein B0A50_00364 [Salinomyces thailandicus]|uniref:ATP-dependent RNA helicase n=1 Tax=Salinomyces thailandicus TaxID=706561 RepID=A0A4V5N5W4_9PEZI|nr:hypothetical protein B0A50_00364 [Salinomyces thailandica]